MPGLIKREVFYAADQSAQGTPAVIAGTDALRAYEISFAYEGNKSVPRPVMGGNFGMPGNVYGGSGGAITLSWEVSGNGAELAAEHAVLYKAAGMSEVMNDTANEEGVEYQLISTRPTPATIAFNQDGWLRKLVDARATAFGINATAGETLRATATFAGVLASDNDTAAGIITPTFNAKSPPVVRAAALSFMQVGGQTFAGAIETIGVDFGLATAYNPDITAEDGMAAPEITDRQITITLNPEFERAPNYHALMKANADIALDVLFSSSETAPANKARLSAPRCRITEITDGDRNGVRTRELTLQAARTSAGNDEFLLKFE